MLNFKSCSKKFNISTFVLKPSKQLILNDSLNLDGLVIQPMIAVSFLLQNFKGFDLKSNPFKNIKFKSNTLIMWSIQYSTFAFYDNKRILIESKCNNNNNLLLNKSFENQFNGYSIYLYENKYSANMCPLMFWNIKLTLLNINRISKTFIETNQIGFQHISNDLFLNEMNSIISHLQIYIYHSDLNSKFLNKHVFKQLKSIDMNGQITNLQEDLFKPFNKLNFIRFRTQNVKNILVHNNKWLNNINYDININPEDNILFSKYYKRFVALVIYQTFAQSIFYSYPNEDFCYFKTFPHNKLIFPILRPNNKTTCSCTEIYLIQYSNIIKYSIYMLPTTYYLAPFYQDVLSPNYKHEHCINRSFEETIKKCNFKQRLNLCHIKQATSNTNKEAFYFYMTDWETLSNYSHLILSVYLNPIISIISILFNILIFITLISKKLPKETIRMYNFLKINSIFNIIFLIIKLFKLIDTCNQKDVICLFIYSKSVSLQYFKIIFIHVFGNVFQSTSNLTHITFTLSRYISITNSKSSFLKMIQSISLKMYLFLILTFSLLINVHIFFQYFIFNNYSLLSIIKADKIQEQEKFDDFKESFSKSEYLILNIFQFIKIIFSDLFYIIIAFVIDIRLLLFVKTKMLKKECLTNAVVNPSLQIEQTNIIGDQIMPVLTSNSIINDNKKQRILLLKKRLTKIIILNGLNFLIFRIPLAFEI